MAAVLTDRVCGAMLAELGARTMSASLHSCFRTAANLSTPLGLVTLLSPGRSLQPYSARLRAAPDRGRLEAGPLTLGPEGVFCRGGAVVSFSGARAADLRLSPGAPPPQREAGLLRRFLSEGPKEGLAGLALGRYEDGPYVRAAYPRLQALRRAVRKGDSRAAAEGARRLAGCGPGLTPSSDDLLCGYLALFPGRPRAGMAPALAEAAAGRTNHISASLLRRAGQGLFSEDALELMACLRRGADWKELLPAMARVASFGSTSGRDFLTGVYFGVLDAPAIGGMQIGQIGNP